MSFDDDSPPPRKRSPLESSERRGDPTSPIALLERELTPAEAETARRLQQTQADPYAVAAVLTAEVADLRRRNRREESTGERLANQVTTAIGEQAAAVDKLERSVESLLSSRKLATKIAFGLIGGVFASLVVVAQALWARAEGEGALKTEIQHMQKTIDKTAQQLEELQRRVDRGRDTP